jgi:hypothetical protein
LTIRNQTNEVVRIAIYRRPVFNPGLDAIAWRIVEPPPSGEVAIRLPDDFEVFARHSSDPSNPEHPDTETNHVVFSETTALFVIDNVGTAPALAAHIRRVFTDLAPNELRVVNEFGHGCFTFITQDGDPLYAPQVVWPGATFIEDVRGAYNVCVVSQFVTRGQRLVQEEISETEIEAPPGARLTVTGSMWTGYAITRS